MWLLANGRDDREVTPAGRPKSVGAEETFPVDIVAPGDIRAALLAQTLAAVARLRRRGLQAGCVTVKFRDGRFRTSTRSRTLGGPTDLRDEIYKVVLALYEKEAPGLSPLRLLGVSLSRLTESGRGESAASPAQRDLFDPPEAAPAPDPAAREKAARLNLALDQVAGRFGSGALRPATLAGAGRSGRGND
jgi:DNA polymerase-4